MSEFDEKKSKVPAMASEASQLLPLECSSTVILVREDPPGVPVVGVSAPTYEIAMVQRASSMGFAANALVFPGGKVDQQDRTPIWSDHPSLATTNAEQKPLQIAAIRELFEETGVLLAYRNGALVKAAQLAAMNCDLMALRRHINDDASAFLPFLLSQNLTPAFDMLTLFARWITPRMVPRRFDTWFYLARLPADQEATADGYESTNLIWGHPGDFIRAGQERRQKIIFPTMRNLEFLNEHNSYKALVEIAKSRDIRPIEPWIETRDGEKFLTIPDNLGYPVIRENLKTALRG